jgi:hypothetical protein
MKVITLLLSLLFWISPSNAQKKQVENLNRNRIEKVINSQWTFNYFPSESADKGYESPGFNDLRWPAISLPHTWNSYETTGEPSPFTRSPGETGEPLWWTGWGWYRKHFSIDSSLVDHKVFIEFKGVQKYCRIWVNGKYVGDHKGGYGSFDFDITGFINPGCDNLLAVAVSYIQKDEFRIHPLSEGNYNVSCGIYRDVTLVLRNKLSIPMQGSASHEGGTLITTSGVSEKEGTVNIKTWVKNDYSQPRSCLLQTSIFDKNGQPVQVIKTEAVINAGQYYMFEQTSKPVINPHLWSTADPFLYTVHSEIIDKKEVIDTYESSFGFRWFRYDEKDNSLYLNDRKTELQGVTRHQEYPWLGDAVPDWLTEMDYSEIRGIAGNNFVRTINYPADEVSCDAADRQGIITIEDFSAVTKHNFSPEEQKQQIREMIRRDRNHPGIISWGAGDEPGRTENKIFAEAEDSTRRIITLPGGAFPAPSYFVYGKKNRAHEPDAVGAGDPAKIIVSCSHDRIAADRGTVVIIKAGIADSKGNHVNGAKNTIMWKISGPAKLSGPAYYVSYADSNRKPEDGWYLEMPATNLIRSNGSPGKIIVTVFSGGLASGSCDIESEEVKTDNSIIREPVLSDAGRKPVVSNPLITERLEDPPREITPVTVDFNLALMNREGYNRTMGDYIKKNNPSTDTLSVEFKTLTDLFAIQLLNNGGTLPAADYNYNADHYNNCRLISGYIARTKLPPLFKESLREYYSKLIICQGSEKNAGDEMNWLNWIPSGGNVVIVTDESSANGQKGVIFTKQTALPDIIKVVYPQFANFSEDARERALIFINKMNPSVHTVVNRGAISSGAGAIDPPVYTAEKGRPILIPEYKFISE